MTERALNRGNCGDLTLSREYLAEGERTRLRRFTRRDVERWLAWPPHADPLFVSYNPPKMSALMSDAWYDDLVNRQAQVPYAVDSLDGQMIGRIFLRFVNRVEGGSVLGIDFDPRFVSQGYGTDALRAFLGYYFGPLGFRRLLLSVAAYNIRARRCYERLGFRYLNSYWERRKNEANVFGDDRYRDIRHLFRRSRSGIEVLFHSMEARKPE
jgi:RimJ/RimL family protein N-acetyltransferase